MSWEILLNNEQHTFTSDDLPALIHGEKGSGASLFSLSLLKQLYEQGEPILVITAHDEARKELLTEVDEIDFMSVTERSQAIDAQEKQVIHLLKEHISILPDLLSLLEDFQTRIVLIKNVEEMDRNTLSLFYTHHLTVFNGDLNTCSEKEAFLQLKYNAKIFFSPLYNDLRLHLPELAKYDGYYQGRIDQGTVRLRESSD